MESKDNAVLWTYQWLPDGERVERLPFLSLWVLPPEGIIRQNRAKLESLRPCSLWSRDAEIESMAREDVQWQKRQIVRAEQIAWQKRQIARETDCMAVEDVDVRYESPWRRSELCWLCLRCFADEDDDLQDFDDQWRKIKCDCNTPHHRGGSQHSCSCVLCSDCWLEKPVTTVVQYAELISRLGV